jgi:hypothetical protein
MFEPEGFAHGIFPSRGPKFLGRAGSLAVRIILLTVFVFALVGLAGAASEQAPIMPNDAHPTADKQIMIAMFDQANNKWTVSELTGPEPPMSVQQFGEQNIWIFYGVKPSAYMKGSLSIKVTRVFQGQDPMQTDYSYSYETTELGSWISFYIGTGGSYSNLLQKITLVVTDHGAGGAGANADTEITRVIVKSQ